MNAGEEFGLHTRLSVYLAIKAVMDEDYDAWVKMDKETLLSETMRMLRGQCNPSFVADIIREL